MTYQSATDKLLTVPEAAAIKGVTRAAIYAAISDGRLSAHRVLGRIVLREEDVQNWQPVAFGERPGAKRRGGRPAGTQMSDESKARLSETQKRRWDERKKPAPSSVNAPDN